jgi:hypothetical protein
VPNSAPDPANYRLIREELYTGQFPVLVVEVEYPDAKNFEGRKIMVYRGFTSFAELEKTADSRIDPHFADDLASPIARFAPIVSGWLLACEFARNLTRSDTMIMAPAKRARKRKFG